MKRNLYAILTLAVLSCSTLSKNKVSSKSEKPQFDKPLIRLNKAYHANELFERKKVSQKGSDKGWDYISYKHTLYLAKDSTFKWEKISKGGVVYYFGNWKIEEKNLLLRTQWYKLGNDTTARKDTATKKMQIWAADTLHFRKDLLLFIAN